MDKIGYTFEGKGYYQRKLLIGQLKQLVDAMQGVKLRFDDPASLIFSLGDRLPLALAAVLIPEGVEPQDKDVNAVAKELSFLMTPEDVMAVIDDFFSLNEPYSLLTRFTQMSKAVAVRLQSQSQDGSMNSSPSSPGVILPDATASSGASR